MSVITAPATKLSMAQANGQLQRNFQGYSTHADCDLVAMGVSAISKIGGLYYQNTDDLALYTELVNSTLYAGVLS